MSPYKNIYPTTIHNGDYALNIKYYSYYISMPGEDFEKAYLIAKDLFFDMVEQIVESFGFPTFSVDGRSGGWLKVLNKNLLPVKAPDDEFINFEEHIMQERVSLVFQLIRTQFNNIKKILEHSESLNDFTNNIERYKNL